MLHQSVLISYNLRQPLRLPREVALAKAKEGVKQRKPILALLDPVRLDRLPLVVADVGLAVRTQPIFRRSAIPISPSFALPSTFSCNIHL